MVQGLEISLRGAAPWQGLTYESEIHPTSGRFRKLQGWQVSRDGSELVRVPGMALVAEPGLADGTYQGNLTGGATTLYLAASGPYSGALMYKDEAPLPTTFVYVKRARNSLNDLAEGWYAGFWAGAPNAERSIEITASSTGTSVGDEDQLWVFRAGKSVIFNPIHGMIECLGLPVIVFESDVYFDATKAAAPVDQYGQGLNQHLQAITGKRKFDFDNVMNAPDFVPWRSTVHHNLIQDIQWARDTDNNYEGTNELQYNAKRIPRKVQLEVYDGRVIIAAPGYGCMFECSLKHAMVHNLTTTGLDPSGLLDALGVPKGCFASDITFIADAANGEIQNGVTVYARVAFLNRFTGEIGLVSELLEATAGAGGPYRAQVDVLIPRWVLRETQADSIYLYTSSFNVTGSPAVLHLERVSVIAYGPDPFATIGFASSLLPDPADIEGTRGPPRIPQMPEGAIWARTLKGHLFSGGKIGREGQPDMSSDSVRVLDSNATWDFKEPFQVSGKGMSPAYQGVKAGVSADPPKVARLARLKQSSSAVKPYIMTWDYDGTPGGAASTVQRAVLLDKSHISFSPKERPGEAPETNRIIADRIAGKDILACGRFGNRLIVCTDHETYGISWGVSPIGVDPQLLHSTLGCIAPESMVETDIGLFWISHRGPVYFDGDQVRWIGKPVEARFERDWSDPSGVLREKKFLRCRSGLMWHVRSVYDATRRTIVWLMRTDEHSTAFASAGIIYTIQSATTTNPVVLTVSGSTHLPQLFQFHEVLVENDIERPDMNGTWEAIINSTTEIQIPYDNIGGSTTNSGQVRMFIDSEQSKIGADESLILQIDTMAFSTQRFTSDRGFAGATRSEFADGARRTTFVSGERHVLGPTLAAEIHGSVFGTDDRFSDRLQAPVVATATEGPVVTGSETYFKEVGTDFRNLLRFESGATPIPCHYQAFIRGATADANGLYELKWWGRIDAIRDETNNDQLRIVNPAGITATPSWETGDVMEIGVIHTQLETTLMNLADLSDEGLQDGHEVRGMTLEHTFRKEHNPSSDPIVAWAFAEGYAQGAWSRLHPETWGHPLLATGEASRIFGGAVLGRETALRMTVISNAQAHLKDIRFDVRGA